MTVVQISIPQAESGAKHPTFKAILDLSITFHRDMHIFHKSACINFFLRHAPVTQTNSQVKQYIYCSEEQQTTFASPRFSHNITKERGFLSSPLASRSLP